MLHIWNKGKKKKSRLSKKHKFQGSKAAWASYGIPKSEENSIISKDILSHFISLTNLVGWFSSLILTDWLKEWMTDWQHMWVKHVWWIGWIVCVQFRCFFFLISFEGNTFGNKILFLLIEGSCLDSCEGNSCFIYKNIFFRK